MMRKSVELKLAISADELLELSTMRPVVPVSVILGFFSCARVVIRIDAEKQTTKKSIWTNFFRGHVMGITLSSGGFTVLLKGKPVASANHKLVEESMAPFYREFLSRSIISIDLDKSNDWGYEQLYDFYEQLKQEQEVVHN